MIDFMEDFAHWRLMTIETVGQGGDFVHDGALVGSGWRKRYAGWSRLAF